MPKKVVQDASSQIAISQKSNYVFLIVLTGISILFAVATFITLQVFFSSDRRQLHTAEENITIDLCMQYKQVPIEKLNITIPLPETSLAVDVFPEQIGSMFDEKILDMGSVFSLNCNGRSAYIAMYPFAETTHDKGNYEVINQYTLRITENTDASEQNVYILKQRENTNKNDHYYHYTTTYNLPGDDYMRIKLIAEKESHTYFAAIFEELVKGLKANGSLNVSDSLKRYTNPSFSYTFQYTPTDLVYSLSEGYCRQIRCTQTGNPDSLITINNLLISAYAANDRLDLDFDEGLDKNSYGKPKEVIIDGHSFYMIFSNNGYLEMIVPEYKYKDDTLWIKKDYHVTKNGTSYYISFDGRLLQSEIKTEESDKIKSILQSMTF